MEASAAAPLPYPASRGRMWQWIPPYALLACALAVAIAPRFIFAKHSEWQQVYVDSARQLRDGQGLYGTGQPYVYPPFMAVVALPFSYLPETVSRALWLLVNLGAMVVCIRSARQLAGGRKCLPGWKSSRAEHAILWIGFACGGYYILDAFGHQQTDLVIAALLMHGCLAVRDGRSLFGGILLGLAAGCKCTPLLFAPYLIWRGRWLAAATLVSTAIAINLLPDMINRSSTGNLWLREWWNTFIAPQVRGDALPGVWASEVIYNQSLSGALNRWTQTSWNWESGRVAVVPVLQPLPSVELKSILRALQLGMVALASLAFLHRPFRMILASAGVAARNRFALECSLVMVLMLLLSPMSSKPHFCILLLPGFCLARTIVQIERKRALVGVVFIAAICGLLTNKDLVKARLYTLALWYGLVTISATLLGIGCAIALVRNRIVSPAVRAVKFEMKQAA